MNARGQTIKRAVVGILAHVDSGKTTLIESMLFRTGAVRKLGSVDKGDSHLDFHELEQRRGITIYAKQALVQVEGAELTLLDTPGHVDFSSEAERTLQVLDFAVLVVDAGDGVRGHTETLWRLLERHGVPTIVFANKMDLAKRPRADVLEELRSRLSDACADFTDVRAAGEMPAEAAEACAETDEQALDEYLSDGTLSERTVRRLVGTRKAFPVLFGSALKQEGVDELLDVLSWLAPSPEGAQSGAFTARTFKVSHDPSGARLTWLKVTSGCLKVKQVIEVPTDSGTVPEKVDQIRVYSGSKFESAPECSAGQICAVAGLSHACAGMDIGARGADVQDAPKPALVPTFACSVMPQGCDVQAVHAALDMLTDEDPLLNAKWNERLQELQVQVMGTIQLEVLQATLHDRFGLDVAFGPSGVLYRETIEEPVVGVGHFEPLRHYAEVHLLIEPLPAGSGVRYGTKCHTDELDLNWQRLILTNAMEREHLGVLTGSPVTDVRITLIGGRAHNKHTEGGDFRQATYRAIRQGLMQARGVLLEPWDDVSLHVPADQVGRAFSDLQRMGARCDAPLVMGDFALVRGVVPAKEIADYSMQLNSYTHGTGSMSLEFRGYEPCHDAEEVIAQAAYDPEADLANTPDSVFCSHGAGHTVKWDEVSDAAHVKPDASTFTPWREATPEFFGG
ncbi:MAG: TetM/TetW/TetO/TetS family tetracycline resistance ribosomal protection protein [Eggerthellaceae bacterium]|nr:TetM/TetW/TetO/TetS family tetracycline resistance ribosomal protection protein [Eggerthellaceae bacterium]